MPFTTWIRDALGIRKDMIDARKAKLEIRKLEEEENERYRRISPATLDDVKKYDRKLPELEAKIERRHSGPTDAGAFIVRLFFGMFIFLALAVLLDTVIKFIKSLF